MNASALADLTRTLATRAFTGDFQRQRASGRERAVLLDAATPVADPLAQDYVAWRRAALWIAGGLLSMGVLLALFDHTSTAGQLAAAGGEGATTRQIEQLFGSGNLALLDGLQVFLLLVKIAVATLCVLAACQWNLVARSRRLTRFAWLAALAVPLLISAWPWGQALDFSHLDRNGWAAAGQSRVVQQQVSVAIGAMLMFTVAPKLIALFPGIIRSALTLKTLLPQAAAPGWLAVVFAPFLVGFLLLVLSFLSQVQGSWLLIGGVVCLAIGPAIYIRRARDLVRPHTDTEVGQVVRDVRKQALVFHVTGGLLLFFYLCGVETLSWLSALHLALEAGGGVLLTMVAISDVTLALLAFGHEQGARFHASDLRGAHEARLRALASAGLTDVGEAFAISAVPKPREHASHSDLLATRPMVSPHRDPSR